MKAYKTTRSRKQVNITHVRIEVDVRHGDEEMPYDFPFRSGDLWDATINIDTGKIEGWPGISEPFNLHLKVVDGGTYTLLDGDKVIARIENDYVPNGVVPGEYGDYVILDIECDGTISNWPANPDTDAFFCRDEDEGDE